MPKINLFKLLLNSLLSNTDLIPDKLKEMVNTLPGLLSTVNIPPVFPLVKMLSTLLLPSQEVPSSSNFKEELRVLLTDSNKWPTLMINSPLMLHLSAHSPKLLPLQATQLSLTKSLVWSPPLRTKSLIPKLLMLLGKLNKKLSGNKNSSISFLKKILLTKEKLT